MNTTMYFAAIDRVSPVINSMRNSGNHFNKDMEALGDTMLSVAKKQDELSSKLAAQKTAFEDKKREVKELTAAYNEFQVAQVKISMEKSIAEMEQMKSAMAQTGIEIRNVNKDMNALFDTQQKMSNRVNSFGGDTQSPFAPLASAGLGNMLGQSAQNLFNAGIASAYGDIAGDAISTMMGSAISGAAMGSMAGPLGAAVGAGVGLLSGGIDAVSGYVKKADDVAKGLREGFMSATDDRMANDMQSGIDLFRRKEEYEMSFWSLLGSKDEAESFVADIFEMDKTNPFDFMQLFDISKTLLTYGFNAKETLDALNAIGNWGATIGASADDMNQVAQTLGYLSNAPTLTQQQMKIFNTRSLPALEYLAAESGMTKDQVNASISRGEIGGPDALSTILDRLSLDSTFEGGADKLASTWSGLLSIFDGSQNMANIAAGEGAYNVYRPWIEEKTALLESTMDERQAMNAAWGAYEAELAILGDKIREKMINAVITGDFSDSIFETFTEPARTQIKEYSNMFPNADGDTMKEIIAGISNLAQAEYLRSDAVSADTKIREEMRSTLTDMFASDKTYYENSLKELNNISEGLASAKVGVYAPGEQTIMGDYTAEHWERQQQLSSMSPSESGELAFNANSIRGNAYGLERVPYDDYLTRLHEGERVLTASEARNYSRSQNAPLPPITGNNFYVREESDIDKIAQVLVDKLIHYQKVT